MNYLIFFLFLFVCMSGVAALSISGVFYAKFKKRIILYYSLFLFSLFSIVVGFTANLFKSMISQEATLALKTTDFLYNYCNMIGVILCVVTLPLFFHSLAGIQPSLLRVRLYWLVVAVTVISSLGYHITGNINFVTFALHPALFGSIFYCMALMVKNYSDIGDPLVKKSVKVFLMVSVPFIPLIVLDASSAVIPLFPMSGIYSTLTLPAYFFTINVLGIIFALRFFDRPAYFDNNSLTQYFSEAHDITAREKDIIIHLLEGKSNKEIGESLFISHKTVENHLSRIYQKTGVRNRLELVSLIQTNRT